MHPFSVLPENIGPLLTSAGALPKIDDDRVEGQSNQHVEHSVIACNWPDESRSVCSHPEPKWGVLVLCRNIRFDLHWQFDWLLPLQQRAVRLPGWARAAPPSGYHSVLLHAVELVHSEHTYTTIVRRWFIVHVVESSWSRGDVESIVKATPTMTAEAILINISVSQMHEHALPFQQHQAERSSAAAGWPPRFSHILLRRAKEWSPSAETQRNITPNLIQLP